MLTCPVCGHSNDDLSVVCVSCKAYLQAKVDTLDLFHTIWGLMEAPAATMRKIVIARQKNYVIFLSCLFGIALAYCLIWYRGLGTLIGFGPALALGVVAGPLLGLVAVVLIGLFLMLVSRILGGHATLRETVSVVAYALVPVVLSLVMVFPVEIAVFGQYLFDPNPPPLVMNPPAYIGLLSLDAIAVAWSWGLLLVGTRVAQRLSRVRAFLSAVAFPILAAAAAALGMRLVP